MLKSCQYSSGLDLVHRQLESGSAYPWTRSLQASWSNRKSDRKGLPNPLEWKLLCWRCCPKTRISMRFSSSVRERALVMHSLTSCPGRPSLGAGASILVGRPLRELDALGQDPRRHSTVTEFRRNRWFLAPQPVGMCPREVHRVLQEVDLKKQCQSKWSVCHLLVMVEVLAQAAFPVSAVAVEGWTA